jgi:tRNA pseudouridine13 synthase
MKEAHPLEIKVGMKWYITEQEGINGKIKSSVEDFKVQELFLLGKPLPLTYSPKNEPLPGEEGLFTHAILSKKNYDQFSAIKQIAYYFKLDSEEITIAGTKDSRAWTSQRICFWNPDDQLPKEPVKVKNGIELFSFARKRNQLKLGDHFGNHFTIIIKECQVANLPTTSLGLVPNYFGHQRFGISRPTSHLVGLSILKGDFQKAVMIYLTEPGLRDDESYLEAKRNLKEDHNFKQALTFFPRKARYERSLLHSLTKKEDYVKALLTFPKSLLLLITSAAQSYLFNLFLSQRLEESTDLLTPLSGEKTLDGINYLPIFGYKTAEETKIKTQWQEVLEKNELHPSMFKVTNKKLSFLSSKGTWRRIDLNVSNYHHEIKEEQIQVSFELPSDSYATVVLREIMKSNPLNYE